MNGTILAVVASGELIAAAIAGFATVAAAYVTVRRPMKREHAENKIIGTGIATALTNLGHTTDRIETKVDTHINDHAKGEFD